MTITIDSANPCILQLDNLRYGQFAVMEGYFETKNAETCQSYCEPYMYRGENLVENYEHGSQTVFFRGACYFVHLTRHFYRFSFIVPKGVDRMELHLECKAGTLVADDVHVYVTDQVEKSVSGIKCVAHLGYAGYAPRNTIHAFELAGLAGFRECVLNINYTRDGQIVTLHNDTIDATATGTGCIREMTYEEANRYDYGVRFNPYYENTALPLLDEAIAVLAKYGVKPVLRLNNDTNCENAEKMLGILKENGISDFTAKGFSPVALENLYEVAGDRARYGYCIRKDFEENLSFMDKFPAKDKYMDVRSNRLTPEYVKEIRARKMEVEAWIENDFAHLYELSTWGVSGFTTDLFQFDNYSM